jgi:hypothetical protein
MRNRFGLWGMAMNDAIQVAIGLSSERGGIMEFHLYDTGARIHDGYTSGDLHSAIAVLLDLADALQEKLRQTNN